MVKRKVHIALDESLVRAIDEVRGPVSRWILNHAKPHKAQ